MKLAIALWILPLQVTKTERKKKQKIRILKQIGFAQHHKNHLFKVFKDVSSSKF